MRRRDFIALLGGAAAAWPLVARAQQAAMPVVGFLDLFSPKPNEPSIVGFRKGLAEAGYIEGRNVAIEFRGANAQPMRLRELAADLVSRQVAVIVAAGGGDAGVLAAKAATSTIPIVFEIGTDPVKSGLVASLNRPGGNITGVTSLTHELAGKRFDLLRELVPQAMAVAYLSGGPGYQSYEEQKSEMLAAANALGRQLVVVEARSGNDFETAFTTLVERGAGALIVGAFPLFVGNRDRLLALAARHKIPAMYTGRPYALAGGLMSYSSNQSDGFRQVGIYTGRILKGEKPADLPVQQPTKFELIINLKTARALGLTVPRSLLVAADEVIE
jgi:putative ABC transport system substrate-binding protein